MTRYLLDANVFIQAKNLHYDFDFCPAFWAWLKEQNTAGKVASNDKIADELYAQEDRLSNWAREMGADFFLPTDNKIQAQLTAVSTWANSQSYESGAVQTFLEVADFWLVAHALAHNFTVVTHEVAANSIGKIKIPNACEGLKLHCITPYDMLRHERARFILGPQGTA